MYSTAPPNFYLSRLQEGEDGPLIIMFNDVRELSGVYGSSPTTIALPLKTVPYRSQGSGSGWVWTVSAKINPWHAFLAGEVPGRKVERQGDMADLHRLAYEDYLRVRDTIEKYGPSPIFILHEPDPSQSGRSTLVMMTQFGSAVPISQSVPSDPESGQGEVFPNIIEVEMTLVEYRQHKIKLGA